jgi:hypothetical protein
LLQQVQLNDPDGFPMTRELDHRLGLNRVGVLLPDPFDFRRGERNAMERTAWISFFDEFEFKAISQQQKDSLASNLANLTKDKKCSDFLTGMLKRFKATGRSGYEITDINKLFERIINNQDNRFFSVNWLEKWEKSNHQVLIKYASTSFGSSGGVYHVTMMFDKYHFGFSEGVVNGKPYVYSDYEAGLSLAHEVLHAYGSQQEFDHASMAISAFSVASEMGIDGMGPPPSEAEFINKKTGKLDWFNFDDANSAYFGRVLRRACPGGKR